MRVASFSVWGCTIHTMSATQCDTGSHLKVVAPCPFNLSKPERLGKVYAKVGLTGSFFSVGLACVPGYSAWYAKCFSCSNKALHNSTSFERCGFEFPPAKVLPLKRFQLPFELSKRGYFWGSANEPPVNDPKPPRGILSGDLDANASSPCKNPALVRIPSQCW